MSLRMLGIVAGNSIVYHYLINYVEVRLAEMSIDFEGDVTEVVDILLNVILSGVDTALTAFVGGQLVFDASSHHSPKKNFSNVILGEVGEVLNVTLNSTSLASSSQNCFALLPLISSY